MVNHKDFGGTFQSQNGTIFNTSVPTTDELIPLK